MGVIRQTAASYGGSIIAAALTRRIREAMQCEPIAGMLRGDVQMDKAYVGGTPRLGSINQMGKGVTNKAPVMVSVETGGRAVSCQVDCVTMQNLKPLIDQHIDKSARIVTDEKPIYPRLTSQFAGGHVQINHRSHEYVNREGT